MIPFPLYNYENKRPMGYLVHLMIRYNSKVDTSAAFSKASACERSRTKQ